MLHGTQEEERVSKEDSELEYVEYVEFEVPIGHLNRPD